MKKYMFVLFYAIFNAQIMKPVINIEPLCFALHFLLEKDSCFDGIYQNCKQKGFF